MKTKYIIIILLVLFILVNIFKYKDTFTNTVSFDKSGGFDKTLTPENPQVLRLGVQVAGILKDKEMSANVLDLMSEYNKDALPLAKKFIDNAFNSN